MTVPSSRAAAALAALAALALSLALAPAAGAAVSVELLDEVPGAPNGDAVLEVQYSTVANLRVVRASPGARTGPLVVEAVGDAPGFVAGRGCRVEDPRRAVCAGADDLRPEAVFFTAGGTVSDDRISVGPGVLPPVGRISRTGAGDDVVDLGEADFVGGAERPRWVVEGGEGADQLVGSLGFDTLRGEGGDHVLAPRERLRGAADELSGGPGADTVDFSRNHREAFGVSAQARPNPASLENLRGTPGNDGLTGDGFANTIDGGAGDDRIDGAGGDDLLLGGGGADNVQGRDGDDRIGGFVGTDVATRTQGVLGRPEIQRLLDLLNRAPEQDGRDILSGGDGADVVKAQADGLVDSVSCGRNGVRGTLLRLPDGRVVSVLIRSFDRAILDLVDPAAADCELVQRSDRRERGMVVVGPRGVRGRALAARGSCPASSLVPCRGRVALVAGPRRTTLAGGTRYSLRRGAARTVVLRPPRRVPRGRAGVLRILAVEAGARRPRTADLLVGGAR